MSAGALVRRVLPFLSILVAVVLVYDAWVFYSRHQRAQQIEQERAEKQAEDAQRVINRMGGNDLKILNFYAAPPVIHSGQTARLCYSVVNAKEVRVEPAVKDLYPALSYCWDVSPRGRTEYRLIAGDGAGHTVTAQAVIDVNR